MPASEYRFDGVQIDNYECYDCYVSAEYHRYNPKIKSDIKVMTLNRQTIGVVTSPWGVVWAYGTNLDNVRRVLLAQYNLRRSLVPKQNIK